MLARIAILSLAALTSACAAGGGRSGPVNVIRYNLGTPVGPGTFSIEPLRTAPTISSEYQAQADSVARALEGLNFRRVTGDEPAAYLVEIAFNRQATGQRTPPPVSIGLGGGGGSFGRRGGGVGLGGGLSTGLGGGRDIVETELSAKLRRRTDSTVIWEGAARTVGTVPRDAIEAAKQSDRLADALFQGFPGQSGITTTVP
ncbi:hypothetical protein [Sphingomonas qomolangmaensis]|uniref:DUF4136 domain-containing protein n=1 Tax=Sphingomonas qomolangmaensis TaxID=2918765 RepID=A0ABY5L7T2_9SPHN|nr:hypothetical protein [Sphingomonas qomolangmaensis]UUL81795.1 hypothetical protein NMP03_11370 [Sphingomonas qomolangmaensis]